MSAVGSILTNSGALTALNSIAQTSQNTNQLQNELASGLAISSPSDNPAGYITAQGFTSQINGLTQATSNANQGVSLLQTAQSAIGQQIGVVQQLNSIAVQAANGTQTPAEAQSLQNLVGQLTGQVSTIANQTQFNNINLLSGQFSAQFQVGANEGQTLGLSINSTTASAIGMNASVASNATAQADGSATVTANTANTFALGALAAGTATITGSGGGTSTITSAATESAASLATAINAVSGTTGVQAQATTTTTFAMTKGSPVSFSMQSSDGTNNVGSAVTVNASSASQAASEINGKTSTSGISASVDKNGNLEITQAAGDNIQLTVNGGTLTPETVSSTSNGAPVAGTGITGKAAVTGSNPAPAAPAFALIQGQVQLQSAGAFSVTGGAAIGVADGASKLQSLSSINVSNTANASQAINIVKYALAGLNNQDGNLGATQQRLTATINNLNSTSTNATTALGVVQDANIPAVANQLTQAQIQAQSGVAALKSSTQLQQTYLSLLP